VGERRKKKDSERSTCVISICYRSHFFLVFNRRRTSRKSRDLQLQVGGTAFPSPPPPNNATSYAGTSLAERTNHMLHRTVRQSTSDLSITEKELDLSPRKSRARASRTSGADEAAGVACPLHAAWSHGMKKRAAGHGGPDWQQPQSTVVDSQCTHPNEPRHEQEDSHGGNPRSWVYPA
jgi:hypothetical protein